MRNKMMEKKIKVNDGLKTATSRKREQGKEWEKDGKENCNG